MSERTKGFCVICKPKSPRAIYTHLNGDKNAPLCQACNMRLRRESASSEQAKRLKLMATLIGGLETALTFSLEEHELQAFVAIQDRLKLLVRQWLGDESASTTDDGFTVERKAAVSPESDGDFVPEPPARNPWWSMTREQQQQFAAERRRAKAAERAEADRLALSNPTEPQQMLPN
jgi:hypothetical protein